MKLKIRKNVLSEALNNVSKALSSKNIVPILSGIKFNLTKEKLILTASDNDITIQTEIEKSEDLEILKTGSIVIKGKYIIDIIRKLDSEFINMEIVDDYKWLSDKYHIEVINGIEFNSSIRNMHLLGYGMNDLGRVNETMLKIRLMNEKVCLKVIEKLQNDGYDISSSKVLDYLSKEGLNTDILDKRKLVKYLIYKKYSDSVIGAYNNLIGVGKKYYIQNEKLTPKEIINLINESGGISVLAHPNTLGLPLNQLYDIVQYLQNMGLMGIEIINGRNGLPFIDSYSKIAENLALVKTVGSDFHSPETETIGINVDDRIPEKFNKVLKKVNI